jgi:hypothetical protein
LNRAVLQVGRITVFAKNALHQDAHPRARAPPRWLGGGRRNGRSTALSLKIRDPKARADLEDGFRKTIGQLLGGAAVLVGAGLAWLQWQGAQQTIPKNQKKGRRGVFRHDKKGFFPPNAPARESLTFQSIFARNF